ncbi:phage tail protein [Pseudokordiimonas caeni]|uniref:phage tail protein n=1 Tax=Pseudokordiimonas caeni TaxID=2997908 RepID=UPI0028114A4E|nr:phage tail protein [Pseudokordiimonas caeni]
MGKIVKSALFVAAVAVATVATGNPWLGVELGKASFIGLSGYAAIAASGAVLGAGMGLLSSVLAPSARDMGQQADAKTPITNSVDTRKAIYGRVRVGGAEVFIEEYDTSAGNDIPNDTLVFVRAVADHPVHGFGQFRMGDQPVSFSAGAATGDLAGNLWLYTHDGRQTAAEPVLVTAGQGWTSTHKGLGIAYYAVKALYDNAKFPYGAGELRRCSIDVLGKRLYDPRKDDSVAGGAGAHRLDDPATWEYSTNPALCILDFLLDPDDALGNAVPIDEIDVPALMAAAAVCDTSVGVKAGGAIPRYSLNGVIDSARPKLENLRLMLTAMSGRMQWLGGKLVIHAGSAGYATAVTFDDDDIIAATFSAMLPSGQRYNEVRGTFIDPEAGFEPAEFPAFVNSAAQAVEGEVVLNLHLPLCQDHREAQRHAKIALGQARQAVMTLETGAKGLLVKPMDVVIVRHSGLGFDASSEDFRVVEHETIPPAAGKPLMVRLGLVAEDASIYGWDPATEELDQNANPALRSVSGREVTAVTGLVLSPVTLANTDGSETAAINVGWNEPGPTVASTIVDVRKAGTSVWRAGGSALRGDNDVLLEVPENMALEVRARHVLGNGLIGPAATAIVTSPDVAGSGTVVWDDIEGDGKPDDWADVTADNQFFPAPNGYWNFGGYEDAEADWEAHNSLVALETRYLRVTRNVPEGNPCGIDSPDNLKLDAGAYPLLQVRASRPAGAALANARPRLLWKRSGDSDWDYAGRSYAITTRPRLGPDTWTTYVFDLSQHTGWSGKIRQLRFEPDTTPNEDDFLIDYIAAGRSGLGDANAVEPAEVTGNIADQYYSAVTASDNSASEDNFGVITLANEGLSPGDVVSFGCEVRTETGKRKGGSTIVFRGADGHTIRAYSTGVKDTGGAWSRVMRGGLVIPENTVTILLQLQRQNDNPGVVAGYVQGRRPFLNLGAVPQPPLPTRTDVEQGANNVTSTSQLADGANLGKTANWSGVANDGGKPENNATRNSGLPSSGPITSGYLASEAVQGAHIVKGAVTEEDGGSSSSTSGTVSGNTTITSTAIQNNRMALIQAELRIRHTEGGSGWGNGYRCIMRLRRNNSWPAEMPIFVTDVYRTFVLNYVDFDGGAGSSSATYYIEIAPIDTGWDYQVTNAEIQARKVNK